MIIVQEVPWIFLLAYDRSIAQYILSVGETGLNMNEVDGRSQLAICRIKTLLKLIFGICAMSNEVRRITLHNLKKMSDDEPSVIEVICKCHKRLIQAVLAVYGFVPERRSVDDTMVDDAILFVLLSNGSILYRYNSTMKWWMKAPQSKIHVRVKDFCFTGVYAIFVSGQVRC